MALIDTTSQDGQWHILVGTDLEILAWLNGRKVSEFKAIHLIHEKLAGITTFTMIVYVPTVLN